MSNKQLCKYCVLAKHCETSPYGEADYCTITGESKEEGSVCDQSSGVIGLALEYAGLGL